MRPTPKIVSRWERYPNRTKPARVWQLTKEEQENAKAAIRILRRHFGWRRVAVDMGISLKSLKNSTETKRKVSAGTALRIARLANASVEEILAGTWKGPPSPCPTCGRLTARTAKS